MTEVAAAYLGVIVVMRSALVWLTARALGVRLRTFARNVAPVAQAVLGMALVAWAVRYALVELDVPAALRLVLVPVAGALAYAGFVAWRTPEILREARQLIRRRSAAPEPVLTLRLVAPGRRTRIASSPGRHGRRLGKLR